MDRIRSLFRKREDEQEYAPLTEETDFLGESRHEDEHAVPFSWIEYGIFVWLGIAMLWAWYARHDSYPTRKRDVPVATY